MIIKSIKLPTLIFILLLEASCSNENTTGEELKSNNTVIIEEDIASTSAIEEIEEMPVNYEDTNMPDHSSSIQGECYVNSPTWTVFKEDCFLDYQSQLGEHHTMVTIGQDGYLLYSYDQTINDYDEDIRKNGKLIQKIDDEPAYSYYRDPKDHTITSDDSDNNITCFKSETTDTEVCYKEKFAR